jgi:hypothetical protein
MASGIYLMRVSRWLPLLVRWMCPTSPWSLSRETLVRATRFGAKADPVGHLRHLALLAAANTLNAKAMAKTYALNKGKQKATEPSADAVFAESLFASSGWDSVQAPAIDPVAAPYLTPAQYLNAFHSASSSRSGSVAGSDGRQTPLSASQPGTPLEPVRPPRQYPRPLLDAVDDRKAELKAKQRLVLRWCVHTKLIFAYRAFKGDQRRPMMMPQQHRAPPAAPEASSSDDDEPLDKRFSRMIGKAPAPPSQPIFGEDQIMRRELERLDKILAFEAEEARKEAEVQAVKDAKRAFKEARRVEKEAKRAAKKRKRLEDAKPVRLDQRPAPQQRASKALSFLGGCLKAA